MLFIQNRIFVLFYHNSCLMKMLLRKKQHRLTFSTIFVIYQKFTSFTVKFINLLCIIEIYSSKGWGLYGELSFYSFEKQETLFDETWTFENDEAAKLNGQQQIEEKGVADKTHRLVNASGKLILFHV